MGLAILMGALAGFVGFVPLWAALRLTQKSTAQGMAATAGQSLGGVGVSLLVLGLALFACSRVARQAVLAFGLAEMVVFVAASVAYFMWRNKVLRRRAQEDKEGNA